LNQADLACAVLQMDGEIDQRPRMASVPAELMRRSNLIRARSALIRHSVEGLSKTALEMLYGCTYRDDRAEPVPLLHCCRGGRWPDFMD